MKLERCGCGRAIKNRVKKKFKRAVRLDSEGDLWAKKEKLPLAHFRFNNGDAPFEVVLTQCPSTAQRLVGVEPSYGFYL